MRANEKQPDLISRLRTDSKVFNFVFHVYAIKQLCDDGNAFEVKERLEEIIETTPLSYLGPLLKEVYPYLRCKNSII